MKKKPVIRDLDPEVVESEREKPRPSSAGQAGDTQGLSTEEEAGDESVEELVEEGQSFEASVISGIENAPVADDGGIKTREVPEDDVPLEYLEDEEPLR